MCENNCDIHVKIRIPGRKTLELMTLEQLYLKCVLSVPKIKIVNYTSADDLINALNVALREDCYNHLDPLMKEATKKQFADGCIDAGRSPFDARKEAATDRVNKCYWPDCP